MDNFFGKILIASPKLEKTPFGRSVIFVLQDNEDATVGVVLNKPADDSVRRAWEGLVGHRCDGGFLSIGGPLAGPVVAIHQLPEVGEIALPNGLYSSATENNLQFLANQEGIPLQVFFGLTGWQKGQLQQEISDGAWLESSIREEFFFCEEGDDLWGQAINRYRNRFFHETLGIKNVPERFVDN